MSRLREQGGGNRQSYTFTMDELERMERHLREEGFALLKGVANAEQVLRAESLAFDFLESLRPKKVKRKNPNTWTEGNGWPRDLRGFLTLLHGGGHCDAAWYLRTLPNVRGAFEQIWKTPDLLVSFDTFIGWRPWTHSKAATYGWLPETEGFHMDQNPITKPDFQCVQGMLPLRPVTNAVGGLCVVPRSHREEDQSMLREALLNYGGDWCVLCSDTVQCLHEKPLLVLADPGDLILWDSRLVHGGVVGSGPAKEDEDRMARLSFTLCMTPKNLATKDVLSKRRRAFERGECLTHWPHEYVCHTPPNVPKGWKPPECTPCMSALID